MTRKEAPLHLTDLHPVPTLRWALSVWGSSSVVLTKAHVPMVQATQSCEVASCFYSRQLAPKAHKFRSVRAYPAS